MENEKDKKIINTSLINIHIIRNMPHHGETDNETKKIYCGYWMTVEEWEDIHDYSINENYEESNIKIE
jgi:hypothetical protein